MTIGPTIYNTQKYIMKSVYTTVLLFFYCHILFMQSPQKKGVPKQRNDSKSISLRCINIDIRNRILVHIEYRIQLMKTEKFFDQNIFPLEMPTLFLYVFVRLNFPNKTFGRKHLFLLFTTHQRNFLFLPKKLFRYVCKVLKATNSL